MSAIPVAPQPSAQGGVYVYMGKDQPVPPHSDDDHLYGDYRMAAQPPAPAPPVWARIASLVVLVVALALTGMTLGVGAYAFHMDNEWQKKEERTDSSYITDFYIALELCCTVESACTFVTLMVCLVLTVAAPRLVLVNPATHGMNCLCATIFIEASVSVVCIVTFSLYSLGLSPLYFLFAPIPLIRMVSLYAYFAVLVAAKCVKREN